MMAHDLANTPQSGCCAKIFPARCNDGRAAEYAQAAAPVFEPAAQQRGSLSAEKALGAGGFGITVSYFESKENILRWRNRLEHAQMRARGRFDWYTHFEVRVAKVARAELPAADSAAVGIRCR